MPYASEAAQKQAQRASYERNKDAIRQRLVERRSRNHRFVQSYLSTHPCVDCGEDDPVVLEFDHVRGIKTKGIADLIGGSTIAKIAAEIELCEVVCANCHKRRTVRTLFPLKLKVLTEG